MNNDTPAFPACNEANVNGTMGMTLRDWFAGQALAMSTHDTPKNLADWAYMVADAMVAAKAMEARKGRDGEAGSVHDSAARQGLPEPQSGNANVQG